MCSSIHQLHCHGDDIHYAGVVSSHESCCAACERFQGCNAWTWNWNEGKQCYLKSRCNQVHQYGYHSGMASGPSPPTPRPPSSCTPAGQDPWQTHSYVECCAGSTKTLVGSHYICEPSGPSPPTPGPPPGPPGHSDVHFSWVSGKGHGACSGAAVQGSDVVQILGNNGISLSSDRSPSGGCVFRTAEPAINLDEFPHLEVDLETSGKYPAYGQHGGQWFSFWMYPGQYAYSGGIAESGEVDFVENINSVRTNFAGCRHNCHETSWGQPANGVRAHVTMHYDKGAERVDIYRCAHGSSTCSGGEKAYVELRAMRVHKPYIYTICSDIWYAKPGQGFHFTVSNLRVLRSSSDVASNGTLPEVVV